jgi:hypothetical protein
MAAHWVVLAAAALTTLVAAAVGSTLAVFAGQALPQAVRHDLANAPGNSILMAGPFNSGDPQSTGAAVKSAVGQALPGVPLETWSSTWSDPLGLVPGALPARPSGIGAGTTPLLEAATLDGITTHAVLTAGNWPASSSATPESSAAPAGAIPAALPATSAALLGLRVGDVLRLEDRNTSAQLTFTITGLYAQRQLTGTAASYWQLDTIPATGSSAAGGFNTYGPLVVSPTAFTGTGQLVADSGAWVTQPDWGAVSGTELSALSASVTALGASLSDSNYLNGMQVTSELPTLFADLGSDLSLARSLLAMSGLQLLALTVAALFAVARLLANQREAETELFLARGATRWQLTGLTAAEVLPLSAVTGLAGGVAGIWLARWLDGSLYGAGTAGGALGALASGGISPTAVSTWADALAATALVIVVAVGALLYPMLRPAAGAARVRRGRRAVLAAVTRAGGDLALIVLAVLAGWQLRRYSAVPSSATGAPASIDPVLALAPALALVGGTVLTLRLLPAAARAADRAAAGGRGLTAALASWQFSRQPLRQGGAALLIVMAVASGTLALAQHQSWTRSTADQAADTVGADVRVDLATPLSAAAATRLDRTAGVSAAMAVAVDQASLPAPVIAVDAAQAASVVQLRPDQSPLPVRQLFAAIAPTANPGFVPAIVTSAFDEANHITPGETVTAVVSGASFPVRIVAQVDSFPTATGGTLIVDLTTLQARLASLRARPLPVTQWWLSTADHGVPALAADLPPGSDITSRTAVTAATADDPLSAAPQQALLAMAAAAALLAVTGFLVAIAANVRQRRGENALLAALGVSQRSAAAQLFLEKLLLAVPAAALGLVLGMVVARLLVPAVTLTTTAQPPVPSAVTLLDLPQTVPLALFVAVLPSLAAALVVFRRPDPAAELRAAEAA